MEIQQPPRPPLPMKAKTFVKNVVGIAVAVFAALVIRSCAFEPYNIPSSSMVPTLLVGDYLFITKYPYGYSKHSFPFSVPIISHGRIFGSTPERGDVMIFKEPTHNKTDFIKRTIGLPGDVIQVKEGRLYINGAVVPRILKGVEQYTGETGDQQTLTRYSETLPGGVTHDIFERSDNEPYDNFGPFTVPENTIFGMGDNRDNSADSRAFGPIPLENLEGRASFIFYSNNGEGYFFQFWKWHKSLRFKRFFTGIR